MDVLKPSLIHNDLLKAPSIGHNQQAISVLNLFTMSYFTWKIARLLAFVKQKAR